METRSLKALSALRLRGNKQGNQKETLSFPKVKFREICERSVVKNKPPTEKIMYNPKAISSKAKIGEAEAKVKASWSPDVQALIDWFMESATPAESFYLGPHIRVIDPEKFFSSLRREIEAGPTSPRGRNGALLYDLNTLRKILH